MTILAGHGEKAMATSPENGFLEETRFLDIRIRYYDKGPVVDTNIAGPISKKSNIIILIKVTIKSKQFKQTNKKQR